MTSRYGFMFILSHSQSCGVRSRSFTSLSLYSWIEPLKYIVPPTIPTHGRYPRMFFGFLGLTPQTTATPPALNSAKESPTFLKYHDCGGSNLGLCFVMVSHLAPPLP